jgi:DNA-binding LacI/PurR family transcriptional regulator
MALKYETVARDLDRQIQDGDLLPGDALPSEQKLANKYEVSRITVRRAIEILEERGQVERQHGRGTFVREVETRDTLVFVGRVRGHFYRDRYVEIMEECQRRGHSLVAFSEDPHSVEPDGVEHLEELLDAASALICGLGQWSSVRSRVPEDMPVVLLSGVSGHLIETTPLNDNVYLIGADGERAAALATEYLIDLGHSRITYVGPVETTISCEHPHIPPERPEYRGHLEMLRRHALDPAGAIGYELEHNFEQEDWQQQATQAIRSFIEQRGGWPDAFVCQGDFRAAPLLRVANREGLRLPEEFSVVGMGNTAWAHMLSPPLTSICMGEATMAKMAVSFCEQQRPDATTVARVQPRLVQRASGRAPHSPTHGIATTSAHKTVMT